MAVDKKLIYINLDGFSYSYYENLLQQNPHAPLLGLIEMGLLFTNLQSGLISITNPMQAGILCGAYSNKTHNFYQHYDWERGEVIRHRRTCDAENIAELFLRHGKTAVSIHQFMLEGRPCVPGVKERAYIVCPQEKSNAFHRLDMLYRLIDGQPVLSGDAVFTYDQLPDFTAVYIDDLDSLGHNNDYECYPKRADFGERQGDILERLARISEQLLRIYRLLERKELLENTLLLITTDHGMTPFFGKSMLQDLCLRLRSAGIRADLPMEKNEDTRVVVLPYTIQLSLYCAPDITGEERSRIDHVCRSAPYTACVLDRQEMQKAHDFDPRGPEFLIIPRYGMHFYHRDIGDDTFAASHDTGHETSRHIFGLLLGGDTPRNQRCEEAWEVIDILPAIAEKEYHWQLNGDRKKRILR